MMSKVDEKYETYWQCVADAIKYEDEKFRKGK